MTTTRKSILLSARFKALLIFTMVALFGMSSHAQTGGPLVGLWFVDLDVLIPAPINQSQIVLNVGRGGVLTTTDTDDFTGMSVEGFSINGPGQGVWKRVRGRSFALDYLFFEYAGSGSDPGLLVGSFRIRCLVEVDGDDLEGSCDADGWFSHDDDGDGITNAKNPLLVDPDFVIPGIWEFHGKRPTS